MDKEQFVTALRTSVAEFEKLRPPTSRDALDMSGADLSGCDLRGVQLREVTLQEVNFEGADLTGANLTHSKLQGARFKGAKLINVNMHETELEGADLRGAVLGGFDDASRMCLRACNFQGVRWGKEELEYFLGVLNKNEEWEIKYQVVPRAKGKRG
ncbi:MAG: pentapeptide repeat protein [Dehalococcoidia bacterium]|nr:pentapeptide repeat protein [Dehalococcoidia bacterium]